VNLGLLRRTEWQHIQASIAQQTDEHIKRDLKESADKIFKKHKSMVDEDMD
jgi:hypothetical protein